MENKDYLEIRDNKIINHCCGPLPKKLAEGVSIVYVDNPKANIGDDIRIYSDLVKGEKKPLRQLIEEGLEKIPEGKKLSSDGAKFDDMTKVEKVKAGLLKLEFNQKIDGDFIVPKTKEELFTEGLISDEEYNEHISEMRKQAYFQNSDPLGLQYLRGEIDKQVWLDKVQEIKNRYPKAAEIEK